MMSDRSEEWRSQGAAGQASGTPPPRSERTLRDAIAKLAADFVGIDAGDIDAAVVRALEVVGRYAGADISAVYLENHEKGVYERTHFWTSSETPEEETSTVPLDAFTWLDEARGNERVFYCPDSDEIQDLPEIVRTTISANLARSFVTVAVDTGDGIRGYVGFASNRPGVWLDEDIALLEVAALIISNALARGRTEKDLARLAEFERLVRLVATVLSVSTNEQLDREVEVALRRIAEFIGCNRAGVYMLKRDRNHLKCTHEWVGAGAAPLKDASQHLHVAKDSTVGQALFEGRVFTFGSPEEIPEHETDRKFFQSVGTKARAQLPLMSGADLVGGLMFASTVSNKAWTAQEVGLLQVAAEVIANAIHRVSTDAERAAHFRIQQLVAGFATEVINAPGEEIDTAAESALARLGELADASRLGLYELDKEGDVAHLRSAWSRDGTPPPDVLHEIPVREGSVVHEALHDPKGYTSFAPKTVREFLSDLTKDSDSLNVVSSVNVSLTSVAGPIGWLGIAYDAPHEEWSAQTADLFRIAAQAFANVLQRIRSEKELARLTEFERSVGKIVSDLVSLDVESIDAVILRTLESIGGFLECDRGTLFELTQDGQTAVPRHNWMSQSGASIPNPPPRIRLDDFPHLARLLREGEVHVATTIEDLPPDATAERQLFERLGIRSRVQVPLRSDGEITGGLVFVSTHANRSWSDPEIVILQVAADLLADASRRAEDETRRRRQEDLQNTITNLATEFINVPFDRIGDSIDAALEKIGTFAGAIGIGLYLIDEEKGVGIRRRGWPQLGVLPGIENVPTIPVKPGTPMFEMLSDPRGFAYMPVEQVAAAMPEFGKGLAEAGIASAVHVTMNAPGGPMGWLAVAFAEPIDEWPADTARLFRIAAQACANLVTRQHIEAERRDRQAFERLIVKLSAEFINVAPETFIEGIHSALAEIGEFSDVDLLAIFTVDDSQPVLAKPYAFWASERGSPTVLSTKPLPIGEFSIFTDRLLGERGPIDIVVSDIPDEAATMREWLERRKIRRVVDFPMTVDGQVTGFLATASLKDEDPLHGTSHALFALAAEMFANELDRNRLQTEADEHRAALAHALRVGTMAELATGLAHELNQPLAAMSNYADACSRRIDAGTIDPEETKELLGRVSGEAMRAGDIIRRLRAHVRKGGPHRAPHRVEAILDSVIGLLNAPALDQNVSIVTDIETDLPTVMVDATEIEQVLINLIQNAMESIADHGKDEREVQVHARVLDDRMVEVSVRDTGGGIAPEAAETLFDQFSSTKAEGLGLGLAICRLIVDSHGGMIEGRPNPEGGAVFRITLPRVLETDPLAGE
jgi:signal transduction histidine kinase